MHKRLSMFDKIMAAVTFAEANEHTTAREFAKTDRHAEQTCWQQTGSCVADAAKMGAKSARARS
ncbi:MAG: hypothetical protein OEV73_03415 [Desulfobulbaceae bacterium]|nr:hypothetical protein [Desulfobulbaceae bacterium]